MIRRLTEQPSTSHPLAQAGAHSAVVAEQPAKQSEQDMPPVVEFMSVKHPLVCGTAPRTFDAQSENTKRLIYFMVGLKAFG